MEKSDPNSIHLFVEMPTGTAIEIPANSNHPIKRIHETILVNCKIPVIKQKLYYKEEELLPWVRAENYSIQNEARLRLKIEYGSTSELDEKIHNLTSKICRICREKSDPKEQQPDDEEMISQLLTSEENSEILMVKNSVPATLVMVYSSEIQEHKSYGESLIRLCMHLMLNRPNNFLEGCTFLAFEFCELLREVSDEDPLYKSFRSTLSQLVERGEFSTLSVRAVAEILVVLPLVAEMSRILGSGLAQSQMWESNPSSHPILHFESFRRKNPSSYLTLLIESLKFDFRNFQASSSELHDMIWDFLWLQNTIWDLTPQAYESTVDSLSKSFEPVFGHLLEQIENHLSFLRMNEHVLETAGCLRSVRFAYLQVLKEMYAVSQCGKSERKLFRSLLKRSQISLRLILEKTTRKDDYHWLLQYNDVITAESRMHLVTMRMIPEEKLLDAESYKPLIHWSRFLDEELFQALKNKNLNSREKLQDWLFKLCQAIFKPENLLFLPSSNDPMLFCPNPELKLEPLHYDCFEFSGKVIALALMHEMQVGVAFHRVFLLQLAGKDISIEDVRDAYPSFYNKNAKNDEIRDDFLNSISEGISFFRKGFDSVFGKSIVQLLTYKGIEVEDLNLVLKGNLHFGFNSSERTQVNQGNNLKDPLMSRFLEINRQRLDIKKSEWRMDRKKTLGKGISGNVYKGYADGGFFFAVKQIRMKNKRDEIMQENGRIQQEVNLLCQLSHPNIVKYYGTEEDELKVYIFLELVSTGSIRQVYNNNRFKLQDSQVSHYTKQILEGLKYLHERNVVHRDIKCANILVDEKGCLKITDFGLTKVTELIPLLKSLRGAIDWTAPEVLKKEEYGAEADIWSLGCTVYEMLIGDYPYSHVKRDENLEFEIGNGTLLNHLTSRSLSKKSLDFIEKCLQVDPNERPTACELLDHPFVKDSGF